MVSQELNNDTVMEETPIAAERPPRTRDMPQEAVDAVMGYSEREMVVELITVGVTK